MSKSGPTFADAALCLIRTCFPPQELTSNCLTLLIINITVESNLNPGGWFEIADIVVPYECDDGTFPKDSALYKWMAYAIDAAAKFGKPLDATVTYAQRLREVGFVNVTERKFKWPTNNWPKDPKYKELGRPIFEKLLANYPSIYPFSPLYYI